MNNQNMNSRRGMPCNMGSPRAMNAPCGSNTQCGPNRGMPRQNAYMQGMRQNSGCGDNRIEDRRPDCKPGCNDDRMRERKADCRPGCNDDCMQERKPDCNAERMPDCRSDCMQDRNSNRMPDCQDKMPGRGMEMMPNRDRGPVPNKKVLMKEIYQLGFALVEIVLYLDTHPCDADALNYYNQIKKRHHMVMEMYQREYGPLLVANVMSDNYWSWVSTPMPWEVEGC